MRPHRYRLRATVWLIRRIIAVLDAISDWEFRRRYPHGY
jgi:hypothetical protein